MSRDDDLVRELLIHIEENDRLDFRQLTGSRDAILYHVEILVEAGFIKGTVDSDESGRRTTAFVQRLTWKGHEFLDDIRSETVWNETKRRVSSAVDSASLSVVQKVAKQVVTDLMF